LLFYEETPREKIVQVAKKIGASLTVMALIVKEHLKK